MQQYKLRNSMKKLLYSLFFALFISSCVTQQDWVYFQGDPNKFSNVEPFKLCYQQNDLLSINVTALDMDAARPFNLFVSSPNVLNNLNLTGQIRQQTYLVDEKGEINFPILGKLKLTGLSRDEATALLEKKLKLYLKDPVVTIRLTNFRVSVLGEVKLPGIYTITNERVSILEALALAGDLNITGKRDNLLLIREEDGLLTKNYIDLSSDNFFDSPYFYLKPNDIIYVEPNKSKVRSSTDALRFTSISLSVITTLTTILSILLR